MMLITISENELMLTPGNEVISLIRRGKIIKDYWIYVTIKPFLNYILIAKPNKFGLCLLYPVMESVLISLEI